MADLCDRLRTLRRERNLKQQDMADRFGQSLRAYQYYEAGTRRPGYSPCQSHFPETGPLRPDYPHLLDLADFFDVSLDYLTGRSETRTRQP